ncbi:acyl-CoA dehydrogenase family protein [Cumulibacter soli]|uniref:acyl-CoA dehydrogenase family protein n=1 Tax=Cumulibacter soli TaxID=2546344 RepID=UPI001067F656|nr:acyl-CoA dehydrogenase family protein [Cumulibacter soli]
MQIQYTSEEERFRQQIRDFLHANLPADWQGVGALSGRAHEQFNEQWRRTILDAGYLGYAYPKEVGGSGFNAIEKAIVQEEFLLAGAPLAPTRNDFSFLSLLGPTLLEWGTPEQKEFFFANAFSGAHQWAQGYSEPEAGSDLFSLRTRAALDGDTWVINGQKIWTTAASTANWLFVLCRTGEPNSGGKGISFLLVPVDQPGVDVRPIKTMTGDAEYCEVFFDSARTDAKNILGPVNSGAKVALTLLGFERSASAVAAAVGHRIELIRLLKLARSRGCLEDMTIRDRFASMLQSAEILRFVALRVVTIESTGNAPGPESSFMKLFVSEFHQKLLELSVDVLGSDAVIHDGPGHSVLFGAEPLGTPNDNAVWLDNFYMSRVETVYGGSSQIQRNTIAERVLGLPR